MTSVEFDRRVLFRGNYWTGGQASEVFDNLGNQYFPTELSIANNQEPGDEILRHDLIADVTTRATIKFENFSTRATNVSLLKLVFKIDDNTLDIEFRDISF